MPPKLKPKRKTRVEPYTLSTKNTRKGKTVTIAGKDDDQDITDKNMDNIEPMESDISHENHENIDTVANENSSNVQSDNDISCNDTQQITRSEFNSLKSSVENILLLLQNKNNTHEVPLFDSSSSANSASVSFNQNSEAFNVTDRGVQHAIGPHVASLVGDEGKSTEPFLFVPSSRPIDMKVSDKLK